MHKKRVHIAESGNYKTMLFYEIYDFFANILRSYLNNFELCTPENYNQSNNLKIPYSNIQINLISDGTVNEYIKISSTNIFCLNFIILNEFYNFIQKYKYRIKYILYILGKTCGVWDLNLIICNYY